MNSNNTSDSLLGFGKINCANYVGYWAGNDDEQLYDRNIKTRYREMESNGWLNSKQRIVYKFNRWGFRSEDFDTTGGIMFLGCSHVVGIGLPEHDTFSHIVSTRLKLPLYRMGVGGGSNDAAFRIADYWIPVLKPSCVVMTQTYSWRLELLSNNDIYNINTGHSNEFTNSAYYQKFVTSSHNGELLKKKNLYAIQYLCSVHNTKLVVLDADSDVFRNAESFDFARDLAHIGKKGNQYLADTVIDLIEQG